MFCYCVFRPNGNYLKLKEISNISSFRFAFRKAQGTRTQDTFIHLMVGADCGFPSGKIFNFFFDSGCVLSFDIILSSISLLK